MRILLALVLSSVLGSTVLAAECNLYNARYKQPDAPWWLTFQRVPQFAAANQTAAFYIELPNSHVTMQGGVHVPNGFGAPLWTIEGPCGPESKEMCTFLDEYENPSIYGSYDGNLQFLNSARGSKAPDQVLLPGLAAHLWYSNYRGEEWFDEVSPGDAFELIGCD